LIIKVFCIASNAQLVGIGMSGIKGNALSFLTEILREEAVEMHSGQLGIEVHKNRLFDPVGQATHVGQLGKVVN
jgi:hypothetical protein